MTPHSTGEFRIDEGAMNELREALANLCHQQWSGWMEYMFNPIRSLTTYEGEIIIPPWAVKRWTRQMQTPYAALSEAEKDSDRKEAEKILGIVRLFIDYDADLRHKLKAQQTMNQEVHQLYHEATKDERFQPLAIHGVDDRPAQLMQLIVDAWKDAKSQLARAMAELEVERKSREDYARLLDDLATAIDASSFAEAIALAKQYAFRLGDGGER